MARGAAGTREEVTSLTVTGAVYTGRVRDDYIDGREDLTG